MLMRSVEWNQRHSEGPVELLPMAPHGAPMGVVEVEGHRRHRQPSYGRSMPPRVPARGRFFRAVLSCRHGRGV